MENVTNKYERGSLYQPTFLGVSQLKCKVSE